MSPPQIKRMTAHVAGDTPLSHEVCVQIADKTDGVPLFVEEITKAILEAGHLKEVDGHYHLTGALPAMAIPATLQDALMARLDRLVTAKAVAQYAAVIGRQCAYDVLSTVSQLDAATLQRELGRLVEAEMVYQRGVPPQATYTFKHALIQDAAYASLLKRTRQQYHQRIAQVLAAQFPDTALLQPELVAHHYTEAGLSAHAVRYWQQAGQRAVERSAYAEAITHLSKGLEVLKTLADTPEHLQQELDLQLALGLALVVSRGLHPQRWNRPTPGRRSCASRWGRRHNAFQCCGDSGAFITTAPSTSGRGRWGSGSEPGPAGPRRGAPPGSPPRAVGDLVVERRVCRCPSPPRAGERALRSPAAPRARTALRA